LSLCIAIPAIGQIDLQVQPAHDFGADAVWLDQGAPAPHHISDDRPSKADHSTEGFMARNGSPISGDNILKRVLQLREPKNPNVISNVMYNLTCAAKL
jgi:hypothetical protein